MRAMVLLMILLLMSGGLPGCNFTTNSGTCPKTTIVLDAGIDGMPDVGEYGSSQTCEEICGTTEYVCCRVNELTFTCQQACI